MQVAVVMVKQATCASWIELEESIAVYFVEKDV